MSLFGSIGNWLGQHIVQPVENFVGNDIVHPVQQVVQHAPQEAYQLGNFLQTHLTNQAAQAAQDAAAIRARLANVHLAGVEQLTGHPFRVGTVVRNAPVIRQAVNFANAEQAHPDTNPLAYLGHFLGGTFKTGAQYAPYAAPETGLLKVGETAPLLTRAAARGVNLAASAAPLNAVSAAVQGKNAKGIAEQAGLGLGAGLAFGAGNELVPAAARATADALAAHPVLGNEAGRIQIGRVTPSEGAGEVPTPPNGKVPAAPSGEAPAKPRGFVQSVQGSPDVAPEVKPLVQGEYAARNTQDLAAQAEHFANSNQLPQAIKTMHQALDVPSGHIDDQTVARGIEVANRAALAGHNEDAAAIYNKLAEHLTKTGQTTQAASLLLRETPQGKQFRALKLLNKAGVQLDEQGSAQLHGLIDNIRNTAPGTQDNYEANQALAKWVNQKLPAGAKDKLFRLWRTGLLTGPQTMTKVLLSHGVMNAMEQAKDVPATVLDSLISHLSGFRTTGLTLRGQQDFGRGTKAAVKLLATGKDTANTGGFAGFNTELGRPQARFTSPALKWLNPYMDKTEQIHAAMPKGFYTAAYKHDLNQQAIAAAKNQGLKGAERSAFIKQFVEHPSDAAHNEAVHAGQMATFQQETKLGAAANKFRETAGGKVLAPFAHIASAIMTDAANYSPVGFFKTPIEALREKGAGGWTPAVQKHFVEGLGRATVGTGVLATGYELYKHGLLTLDYPKDPKEAALWKAEGKQPNSILIDGKWRQLASVGPAALTLAMGGYSAAAKEIGGKGNAALAALAGAVKTLSNESFLSGLSGAAGAINNPELSAKSFIKNEASSVIPIAVGTVAKATDPTERSTPGVVDALKAKIPFLRQSLVPQQDQFGNDLPRQGGVMTNLLDPTRPTNAQSSPVLDELKRLDSTHNTVFPVQVKTIGSGPSAVKLTPQQQYQRTALAGPMIQNIYSQVMKSPGYQNLSDTNKAKALTNAASDVNSVVNVITLRSIDPAKAKQAEQGLTTNQKAMLQGQTSTKDYTNLDANGHQVKATSTKAKSSKVKVAKAPKAPKGSRLKTTGLSKTKLSARNKLTAKLGSRHTNAKLKLAKAPRIKNAGSRVAIKPYTFKNRSGKTPTVIA